MPTLQRDEQKAADLLSKAEAAVLALGFEPSEVDAIKSMVFGIQNYVIGHAAARESQPAADEPQGEFRAIDMTDSGEGQDTLGSFDQ